MSQPGHWQLLVHRPHLPRPAATFRAAKVARGGAECYWPALFCELGDDNAERKHCLVTAVASQIDVVAVAAEVVDRAELLATHGFRLTAQTSVEVAVISAASARIAAGSRMNMGASDS